MDAFALTLKSPFPVIVVKGGLHMSRVLGVEYFCWVSCCAQRPNGSPKRA